MSRSGFLAEIRQRPGPSPGGSWDADAPLGLSRAFNPPPWGYSSYFGGGLSGWMSSRTEQVRHMRGWVHVAVCRTASQIASVRPGFFIGPNAQEAAESRTRAFRSAQPAARQSELSALPGDHPVVQLFNDPNPEDTGYDLIYETSMFLELTGTAYWWVPKNKAKRPYAIYCLPSHWVWPVVSADRKKILRYELRPVEGYTGYDPLPPEDVVTFKFKSPISKWDGLSPQSAGAVWIDCSEAMDRARWHGFKNGINVGHIFEFDGTRVDPDEEMLKRIRAKIQEHYAGPNNAQKPLLVPPGLTAKPLGFTMKELDFGQSFEQVGRAILAVWGVPPSVAGWGEGMTLGSVLASMSGWAKFCLNPRTAFLGQAITERVCRIYDPRIVCEWPDLSPVDPAALEQMLRTDLTGGLRTRNEMRAVRGLKPLPGEQGSELCFAGGNKEDEMRDRNGETDDESAASKRPSTVNGEPVDDGGSRLFPGRFSLNGSH